MKLYFCVVEDNNDIEKLGRVKIRIVGKHTENKSDSTKESYLPVSDLPWSYCISPTNSPNISGKSNFGIPANGSVCICAFIDQEEQLPIVLGTIATKVNALPDFTNGFCDPNQIDPKSDFVGESQISRLARNEKVDQTIIQHKKDNVITGINCNGSTFDEPTTEYNTTYPKNKVIETEKHIIEIDDTDGSERIHFYHNSGTFDEYFPNGSKVEKVQNKRFSLILNDDNILVEGNQNIRIEGNQNIEIVGEQKLKIGSNLTYDVGGNSTFNVDGNVKIESTGSAEVKAGTTAKVESIGNASVIGANVFISGGTVSIN